MIETASQDTLLKDFRAHLKRDCAIFDSKMSKSLVAYERAKMRGDDKAVKKDILWARPHAPRLLWYLPSDVMGFHKNVTWN